MSEEHYTIGRMFGDDWAYLAEVIYRTQLGSDLYIRRYWTRKLRRSHVFGTEEFVHRVIKANNIPNAFAIDVRSDTS